MSEPHAAATAEDFIEEYVNDPAASKLVTNAHYADSGSSALNRSDDRDVGIRGSL